MADAAPIKEKLVAFYKKVPCMPFMVRLAWHDAGTYCAETKTGGANGSIRFDPEIGHGANAGLNKAIELVMEIKTEFPDVSFADFFQLASITAIEAAGGPSVPFRFGRKDAEAEKCTPDGRLPDATKRMPHLREVFHRMGLTDKDIVVLSGAHCLGSAHKDRSGFEGAWTGEPLKFDNSYFQAILAETADEKLLRLESDMALLDEPELKALCETYAKDQDAFFKDYVVSHQKLSELGFPESA